VKIRAQDLLLNELFVSFQTTLASMVQRGARDATDPEVQRRKNEDDPLDHGYVGHLLAPF